MMTGPTTSSLFTADAWQMSNTIQISSLGATSTSYLHIRDTTNSSTLLTLQSDGIADFGTSIPRASTLATSNYDLVNLSTLSNAVAYLEGITSLNFVPYVGSLNNLDMGASTITTTGLMSAGALRITSSVSNVDYSLSVNGTDFLEFTNLLTNQKVYTDGDSFWVPNRIFCNSTIYTSDLQMGNAIYFAYGTGQQWGTTLNGSGEYVIQDDLGATRLKLSKSTGLTVSTLTVTAVPSAVPSVALGLNGGGQVVSYPVPSAGGTVNTSTTTARFLPYLSTGTTLTNSLLNQIDNDSIGLGYTAIPSYPLGSAKNMYVNGSIFAGGLNSMVGTFGRNTTTGNQNEITFTASGVGTLLAQIKSHSGPSALVDATWTYSNTNPAPLGANQGQVLLTADKLTLSLPSGAVVNGTLSATSNIATSARLVLDGVGATEIYNGYIDTYNPTGNNNLMIRSWWGIGFPSYDNIVRIGMDTRTGNADFVGTLTAGNMTVTSPGIFKKLGGASGTNYIQILGNDTNSPYIEFLTAGARRAYIGYATATTMDIFSAGGAVLRLGSENVSRMTIQTDGRATHSAGDNSYMTYGPNSTWNANLIVGATPDRSGAGTAQVITTNGNVHIDGANSNAIYYGFYANLRGTPNPHYFFGGNYEFGAVPQNEYPYAHVACFFGDRLRRSQCMMREVYKADYVSWGGGINMVNSFYKYNAIAPVKISGKYSAYVASAGVLATMVVRVYSQSSGVFRYYPFITYQNLAYVQTTYPFELILSSAMIPETGWFDIFVYSSFALLTDINNQLHVNVQLLPVDAF
jgi:hypothetical protein